MTVRGNLGQIDPIAVRANLRLMEITAKFAENPPPKGTEISAFREAVGDFPPEWQGLMMGFWVGGYQVGLEKKVLERRRFIRETGLCGCGMAFILIGIALPFVKDPLSTQQLESSRILIAGGLSAFLVFLPGFLKLQGTFKPNAAFDSLQFQAGGGAAIFILTYLTLRLIPKL